MSDVARCGSMVVRFEGVLDPPAAAKTLARIAELACREIVLDLERAREVSDVALALLAGGLARMPQSHVVVLGLDARRERELRDLGAGHLLARGV